MLHQLLVLLFIEHVVLFNRIFLLKIVVSFAWVFDDVGFVVEHTLKIFHLDPKECADTAWQRVDIPNMGNWRNELDVPHAAAAHFAYGHFHTAFFTYYAFVSHLFVFAAQTLIVFNRSKNLGTKEPVALGLERTVVDGFRLFDFPVGPAENLFWTCQLELDSLDIFWSLLFTDFNWYQFLHRLFPHLKFLHRFQELGALL